MFGSLGRRFLLRYKQPLYNGRGCILMKPVQKKNKKQKTKKKKKKERERHFPFKTVYKYYCEFNDRNLLVAKNMISLSFPIMQITCWEAHTNSERGRSRTSSFDQGNFSHSQGLLREGGGVWEQRQCVAWEVFLLPVCMLLRWQTPPHTHA